MRFRRVVYWDDFLESVLFRIYFFGEGGGGIVNEVAVARGGCRMGNIL